MAWRAEFIIPPRGKLEQFLLAHVVSPGVHFMGPIGGCRRSSKRPSLRPCRAVEFSHQCDQCMAISGRARECEFHGRAAPGGGNPREARRQERGERLRVKVGGRNKWSMVPRVRCGEEG